MTVYRAEKTKNYTVMSILHLRDKRLSLKAKGIMSIMLSNSDDWTYSEKGLAKGSKDNVDAVKTALQELEKTGYLVRRMVRDKKGRYKNAEYVIKEKPIYIPEELKKWVDELPEMCVDIPIGKKPITENPLTAKPITEKHVESNINVCNKRSKESSIYQSKKKIEEVREQVKEAIAYDKLTDEYEAGDLDLIVKVMTETLLTSMPYININGEECDTGIIKEAMHKIGAEHIRYVLNNIEMVAPVVQNVDGYIRTCLYNAATAMPVYYKIKSNHDLKRTDYYKRCIILNHEEVDDDL